MTFFFIMIIGSNIIFTIYWLYLFFNQVRSTLRLKVPKIYLLFFLCGNKTKLEIENEIDHELDKIDEISTNLENIIMCKMILLAIFL